MKNRKAHAPVVAFIALVLAFAGPSNAAAAEAAPAWSLSQYSFPTVFVPGSSASINSSEALPQYSVVITNVGGALASGGVQVTATIPGGVTFDSTLVPEFRSGPGPFEPCQPPSTNTVTCEIAEPVAPGAQITVAIPLDVAPSAIGPLVSSVQVNGGGAPPVSNTLATNVGTQLPSFDFLPGTEGLRARATAEDGNDAKFAGSHPFFFDLESNFTTRAVAAKVRPVEDPKDLMFQLPPGAVVNPQATTKVCTEAEIVSKIESIQSGCPAASQVGQVLVESDLNGIQTLHLSLYNMQPPAGVPAELAFNILGAVVHIQGGLDGGFHLTAGSSDILALEKAGIIGARAILWGNPGDARHDDTRRGQGCAQEACHLEPDELNKVPLVSMPTSCGTTLGIAADAKSWQGSSAAARGSIIGADGKSLQIERCDALAFEPTIQSKATTSDADSPSGLAFSIHQPQDESLEGLSTAALRDVRVALPEGFTLNAAGANGLDSCTEEQMGYAPSEGKILFETRPQSCPNAAKVGTVEVKTPLLGHELSGSVYVAKPFLNPLGSLLAVYLAVEDEDSGIVAKLAGKVEPDLQTGQLTAIFTENPELPIEDIQLQIFNGPNATLKTGLICGPNTTSVTLTPWSAPEGADAHRTSTFPSTSGCYSTEGAAPKSVVFSAGTVSPLAGAYSPFVLRIARPDGTQHITGVETTLPGGLLGKLAGLAYCSDAGIAQARSREAPEMGKLEQQQPSCPINSEVGKINVTAGSGTAPIPVSGRAYMAGPYKGAPLSLVAIVPAVAGPFDLGTVVDRVALYVGEYDARIHAVADPLPTIREGIPLDVRSIEIALDRPGFTLNPTSCEAKAIEGSVSTQAGQSAALKNRFQVGDCQRLNFKPRIAISLKGGTKRAAHPALKATVTYPKGPSANLTRAQVSLPHSEFLDQNNIGQACTKPVLAARACPAKSIYGKVKLWTSLLERPLEGPLYLVGGYGYKLPALVAELNGQIRVLAVGKVDTGRNRGIRNTFTAIPDAPFEKFVLELKGGKKYGLLINSENICKKKQTAKASFTAQNGKVRNLSPVIANSCKLKHPKSRNKKH